MVAAALVLAWYFLTKPQCVPGTVKRQEPLSSSALQNSCQPAALALGLPPLEAWRTGTDADSAMITYGPTEAFNPSSPTYPGSTSVTFEGVLHEPVLAPIRAKFIGWMNRNVLQRSRDDGIVQSPYNDLELCFESLEKAKWPQAIFCVYHLYTTPLLRGHLESNSDCWEQSTWGSMEQQGEGRTFYETTEMHIHDGGPRARACKALLGRTVEAGDVIGYSGRVDTHAMVPMRWKVKTDFKNPLQDSGDTCGDPYLQWTQPMRFLEFACSRSARLAPVEAAGTPLLDTESDSCAVGLPWVCNATTTGPAAGQLESDRLSPGFKY
eukprot:CAMPEP_0172598354 /NCGR_PEP_ID=MMETSP1068-20121228/18393_1 /TAXON_ID=35684 /ORGANISM="Pseudopedinella elastica, Strain CCMP716" /LENGTH=322 /DNA_ID=CAMNT_0013398197 /DNA_START=274 /DNA_END=1242 /DNA_ORIENTATION=-